LLPDAWGARPRWGSTSTEPVEPPRTPWRLPPPDLADESGLVAVGADLEPGTLLAAYRHGLFPMPFDGDAIGWWSPDPRGVLPLDGLIVSRSLHKSRARFEVRRDTAFREVMQHCADPSRPHGWINHEFVDAYDQLHRLGWAHSVETWRDGRLVGGLYGVRINGLFAGESMFHHETDASKVALIELVEWLRSSGGQLLDVQWRTPHLATLGVIEISRAEYLHRLKRAVRATR
jgi:leucyl/phenylalanyl-tRNA---protein transferase